MPTAKEIVTFMDSLNDDLAQVLDTYVDTIPDDSEGGATEYAAAILTVLARLAATLASKIDMPEAAFLHGMAESFQLVNAHHLTDKTITKAMGGADPK